MNKYLQYYLSTFVVLFSLYATDKALPKLFYSLAPKTYCVVYSAGFLVYSTLFPHKVIDIKSVNKTLKSKNFRLELLEKRHFPDYIEAFSHRVKNFLNFNPQAKESEYIKWLDFELIKQKYGRMLIYVVINNHDQVLGSISVSRIPLPDHGQIFGWLNEKHWGSGTTQETIRLSLGEFFRVSGETESNAFIEPHNIRCYKALKKMGFELAGRAGDPSNPDAYIVKITADTIKKLDENSYHAFKSLHTHNNFEGYSHKIITDLDLESDNRQSQKA